MLQQHVSGSGGIVKLELDQCLSAWVSRIDPRFHSEEDDASLEVAGSEYL